MITIMIAVNISQHLKRAQCQKTGSKNFAKKDLNDPDQCEKKDLTRQLNKLQGVLIEGCADKKY